MLNFLSSVKNSKPTKHTAGYRILTNILLSCWEYLNLHKTCCQLRYSGSLAKGDFQSWTKSTNSLHVVPWIIPSLVASSEQLFSTSRSGSTILLTLFVLQSEFVSFGTGRKEFSTVTNVNSAEQFLVAVPYE